MNSELTCWELINPSDKITFTGNDFKSVAIAVYFVGNGFYAAKEIESKRQVPLFVFGGIDKWFVENFGVNFKDAFDSCDKREIADILDSFTLVNEISSMNNICKSAYDLANNLRKINGV